MTARHVLITGAAGGLGFATLERLRSTGWTVYAGDLPSDAWESLGELPSVVPVRLDVTDDASVAAALEEVGRHTDQLHGVVNFAGIIRAGSVLEVPDEALHRMFEVNLWGMVRVNRAAFPLVRRAGGRIVNISSETGWQSSGPFNGPYAMTKHAVEAYSDALRRELALLRLKVVTVQPGPFRTAMVSSIRQMFDAAAAESELFGSYLRGIGDLAVREQDKANDPDVLAEVVERALTTRWPRPRYSVRPGRSRVVMEWLPTRLTDALYTAVLRRAGR